jgi:hypothetical protein
MIRSGYEIDDIQLILVALLKSKATAPWNRWETIIAWSPDDVYETIAKPIIYVERPDYVGDVKQAGGKSGTQWECLIGLWANKITGGSQELGIMDSQLLAFFRDKKAVHQTLFTVILGTVTYTNTVLLTQGVSIQKIGPTLTRENDAANNSFRVEHNITIIS